MEHLSPSGLPAGADAGPAAPQGSFIVPVRNESAVIVTLLSHLQRHYPQFERIVVDGGSSDNTVALALPLCDQLLVGDAGRARQMNLGARVASGDVLFFLHADTGLGPTADELENAIAEKPLWGFARVQLSGRQWAFRVIEWFMNGRSQWTRVATGDQMIFVSRDAFLQQGGFDDIALMEDVALCKRLRKIAAPVVLTRPVRTSSRRWEEGGVLRTVLRMWILRFAYWCGASPSALWKHYYGR